MNKVGYVIPLSAGNSGSAVHASTEFWNLDGLQNNRSSLPIVMLRTSLIQGLVSGPS